MITALPCRRREIKTRLSTVSVETVQELYWEISGAVLWALGKVIEVTTDGQISLFAWRLIPKFDHFIKLWNNNDNDDNEYPFLETY